MSLIITSNQYLINSGDYNSAFSYNNSLNNTLRIPKDSEIAVQSVKINKDGTIAINRSSVWYQYFNRLLSAVVPQSDTTGWIHKARPFMSNSDDDVMEVSPLEFASRISTGMNDAIFNPEVSGFLDCKVKVDATGFKGFEFIFKQKNASLADMSASLVAGNFLSNYTTSFPTAGLTYTIGTKALRANISGNNTTIAKYHNVATLTQPLSLNDGGMKINLAGVSGANWTIGLSRSNPLFIEGGEVPYYQPSQSVATRAFDFYDFKICAEQSAGTGTRFIKLYHSVLSNDPSTGDLGITQTEIKYFDIAGNPFNLAGNKPNGYSWSANGSGITDCEIIIKNEIVNISLFAGATEYKILEYDATRAKGENFKPIAETCRMLYPKFHIDSTVGGKQFIISEMKVHTNDGLGVPFSYTDPKKDWWSYLTLNNIDFSDGLVVDTRIYNDMSSPTLYTCLGINASSQLESYSPVLIVNPDLTLYTPTPLANLANLFGFDSQTILDAPTADATGLIKTFTSASPPVMKSNTSLFVRLNNFNHNSVNAGKGNLSKILYSLPRFSVDGSTTGTGLYYEPSERLYIKLNNPNDLTVNEFNVDFVNENETLATDLSGKSVVIFHIRKVRD